MRQIDFVPGTAKRWLGLLIASAGLAGCSTDVIRLDSPASFSLNDSPNAMSRPQASMARSGAGAASVDLAPAAPAGQNYSPPRPLANEGVKVAALPEPAPAPAYEAAPVAPSPRAAAAADKGEAITVAPGDTLYGLSKRHHASIAELMAVNGLSSPNLKPGQTLYLPAGKPAGKKPLTRPAEVASAAVSGKPATAAAAPPSAAIVARYDGSYTVKKGDSLYALALQMKVPLAELQQVNGITDVRKVKPGAILKVPSSSVPALPSSQPSVAAAPGSPGGKVPPSVVTSDAQIAPGASAAAATQPVLLNGDKKVATAETGKPDAPSSNPLTVTPPAVSGPAASGAAGTQVAAAGDAAGAVVGKLRWPAKGKIIASFGARPDGTHNDGVNLSVPLGAEVHAAEAGVVAYAGSELKGYGNLILVRHDNGWITAYAHNEEMLAKRGDKVKRGQVIAKAGKSGQVDAPQVHFELRQGSRPVDPTPFMEKL